MDRYAVTLTGRLRKRWNYLGRHAIIAANMLPNNSTTMPLGHRHNRVRRGHESKILRIVWRRDMALPLPEGEGWGEGEEPV